MTIENSKTLPINELYTCLQGEGKLTGVPHILIRVSGCRLRCQFANSFCDTPYASWKPEKGKFTYQDIEDLEASVRKLNKNIKNFDSSCFTGEYVTDSVNEEYLKKLNEIRVQNK